MKNKYLCEHKLTRCESCGVKFYFIGVQNDDALIRALIEIARDDYAKDRLVPTAQYCTIAQWATEAADVLRRRRLTWFDYVLWFVGLREL